MLLHGVLLRLRYVALRHGAASFHPEEKVPAMSVLG